MLFKRRPSSGVTVTTSSIRTPNRPPGRCPARSRSTSRERALVLSFHESGPRVTTSPASPASAALAAAPTIRVASSSIVNGVGSADGWVVVDATEPVPCMWAISFVADPCAGVAAEEAPLRHVTAPLRTVAEAGTAAGSVPMHHPNRVEHGPGRDAHACETGRHLAGCSRPCGRDVSHHPRRMMWRRDAGATMSW